MPSHSEPACSSGRASDDCANAISSRPRHRPGQATILLVVNEQNVSNTPVELGTEALTAGSSRGHQAGDWVITNGIQRVRPSLRQSERSAMAATARKSRPPGIGSRPPPGRQGDDLAPLSRTLIDRPLFAAFLSMSGHRRPEPFSAFVASTRRRARPCRFPGLSLRRLQGGGRHGAARSSRSQRSEHALLPLRAPTTAYVPGRHVQLGTNIETHRSSHNRVAIAEATSRGFKRHGSDANRSRPRSLCVK